MNNQNNFTGRNAAIWAIIVVSVLILSNIFPNGTRQQTKTTVAFSDFLNSIDQGLVQEVEIKGNNLTLRATDGRILHTYAPFDPGLIDRLTTKNVRIVAVPTDQESPTLLQMLLGWLPTLLFVGFSLFFYRQMQAGGNKAMSFGQSKARRLTKNNKKVSFDDVAGVEEAKEELSEVVDFLKDSQKYQRLGGKIPRGVLLVGPPGTGKTLLARAVAGEANVPFFSISGSDFVEMFVGVGASRVRDMFEQGKQNAPCIIFIDEIDAVGRQRGAGLGGGNDEREQTLNQLLVEMDGFEGNESVILIAATNRPDVLDPALLRPGRFDRQVVVPNPDLKGREKILKVHMRNIPLAKDVVAMVIARGTPGFSGADLANLVNEAALMAAREGKKYVAMRHFEEAKDKVMMGAARRSMIMTDEEKRLTAFHEGGHALVAAYLPESDPIHKATILPRGRALGMVMRLPETDRLSVQKIRLLADLAVGMGGRVAEEEIFGIEHITTGASSDIKMVTDMARRMVTEWGMSEAMGPMMYGDRSQEVFLGHTTQSTSISEATLQKVDQEIRAFVDWSYNKAKEIISKHRDQLILLAEALLEHETLTGPEIHQVLRGETLVKGESIEENEPAPTRKSSIPTGGSSTKPQPV